MSETAPGPSQAPPQEVSVAQGVSTPRAEHVYGQELHDLQQSNKEFLELMKQLTKFGKKVKHSHYFYVTQKNGTIEASLVGNTKTTILLKAWQKVCKTTRIGCVNKLGNNF